MNKSVSKMRLRRLLLVGCALLAGCSETLGIERLTGSLTPNGGSGGGGMPGGSGGAPNGGSDGVGMPMAGTDAGGQGGRPDGGAPECGGAGQPCCEIMPSCQMALACSEGTCVPCAAFEGVPVLSGDMEGYVGAISGDGKVVVGRSVGGRDRAYRFVRGSPDGAVDLGVLAGGMSSRANDVSDDGYAVVGEADTPDGLRAFRWTPDQGLISLGVLYAGDVSSRAVGVSADGNVVVGISTSSDIINRGFLWRASSGMRNLPLDRVSGVSADGNTVVGEAESMSFGATVATRWTIAGAQALGALIGDDTSFGNGISRDGLVVVGTSGIGGVNARRGFRWASGTMYDLTGLAAAFNTNSDGSVVVGTAELGYGGNTCSGGAAAGWRLGQEVQYMACEWLPPGVVTQGWLLDFASDISDDATLVAGDGHNPGGGAQGWVAVLGAECQGF